MLLLELGTAPTCLGLRCLIHAFHVPHVGVSFSRRPGRATAAAPKISGASLLLPFRASNIAATREHRHLTTSPSPTISMQMSNSRLESTGASETIYASNRRVVHISTRQAQAQARDEQQQSGSSGLATTISDIIAYQAAVSISEATELVKFGAVYIGEEIVNGGSEAKAQGKVTTKRRPDEPVGGGKRAVISEAQRRKMNSKSADEPPFIGTSFSHVRLRRLDESEALFPPPPGSYLRVHCDPRAFPAARTTDWRERLVVVTEDYVVVDKPTGVPSVPTIDNAVDNALHRAGLALASASAPRYGGGDKDDGYNERTPPPLAEQHTSLHAVSRLDVCTSGLIVFARSAPAAAALNRLVRERRVSKRYLALLAPGPTMRPGPIAHCCRSKAFDGRGRPRVYANHDKELLEGGKWGGAWIEARSTILQCTPATGRAVVEAVARDDAELEEVAELSSTGAAVGLAAAARVRSADREAASESPAPYGGDALRQTKSGADEETTRSAAARGKHRLYPPQFCVMELDTGRTHQLRLQLAAMGAAIVGDTRYRGVIGRIHRGVPADDRTDIFGSEPEAIALHAARLEFEWKGERKVYSAKRPPWASASEDVAPFFEDLEKI